MADYWIKLYHELLDDPKMATLPDRLWRRTIELFLCAGRINKDGWLPDTNQLAWMLRISTDDMALDLQQISSTGIIQQQGGGWLVTAFAKRQAASTDAERKQHQRDRERHEQYSANVTIPVTKRDVPMSQDVRQNRTEQIQNRTEEEREIAPPTSSFSQIETAAARSQFGDHSAHDAERLYQAITGQISMPTLGADAAREDLSNILDYYEHDIGKAEVAGRPIFAEWCNTRGKNGRNYSPVNPAWTQKWLERIAPHPKVDTVSSVAEQIAREVRAHQ